MRSSLRSQFALSLTFALAVLGCTEELPIDPVTTGADDWTPTFTVIGNGYQRVELRVSGPPRKELIPNIAQYVLSVVRSGDMTYQPVDTIYYVPPSYAAAGNHDGAFWQTPPRLAYGAIYSTMVSVYYRTGTVRHAYGPNITSESDRGKILRTTRLPTLTMGIYGNMDRHFAVWKGSPIVNSEERLYAIDTTTGTVQYLTSLLPAAAGMAEADRSRHGLAAMGVDGDTLVAAVTITDERRIRITKVNLNTLTIDSSRSITWGSTIGPIQVSIAAGQMAILFDRSDRQFQVVRYDVRSGVELQTYQAGFFASPYRPMVFTGTSFWISGSITLNGATVNTLSRFDPATFAISEVHRNPVYRPERVAWDGVSFWIADWYYDQTLSKISLEGL
jgi:hypothetical protein